MLFAESVSCFFPFRKTFSEKFLSISKAKGKKSQFSHYLFFSLFFFPECLESTRTLSKISHCIHSFTTPPKKITYHFID